MKKRIGIFICGLGCNFDFGEGTFYNRIKNADYGMEVVFVCNQSFMKTLYSVFLLQHSVFSLQDDKFIKKQLRMINKYLDQNYEVYIGGHSWGGSCVHILHEKLKDHPLRSRIKWSSFGSIYISDNDITNYMSKNDYVLKLLFPIQYKNISWNSSKDGHFSYEKHIKQFFSISRKAL
jgi:hypothetical protein